MNPKTDDLNPQPQPPHLALEAPVAELVGRLTGGKGLRALVAANRWRRRKKL